MRALLIACFVAVLRLSASAATFCETVPANEYRLVGSTLCLPSVEVHGTTLYAWPPEEGTWIYTFDYDDNGNDAWSAQPTFSPGMGMFLKCPQTNLCCFEDPTNAPALPLNLPSPAYWLLSCQSNMVAFFEDIVGRAPSEGTRLYKLNPGGYPLFSGNPGPPDYSVYTYANHAWSPATPSAAVGEAVFIYNPAAFTFTPTLLNPRIAAGTFTFEVETVYGRAVKIEFSGELPPVSWQELSNFVGDGHAKTVTDPGLVNLGGERYYRVRSTSP